MDNFLDSGLLHWAPNDDSCSELANRSQELMQTKPRENCLRPGLFVGRAARRSDMPDRPSRPPDKGQTGID
jgi:hypothetical protein